VGAKERVGRMRLHLLRNPIQRSSELWVAGLWEQGDGRDTIFRECVFVFNTFGTSLRDLTICKKEKKWKETGNEKVSRKKVRQSSKGLQHQYFFFPKGKKASFF
jgi:hypothetical protein